MHSNANVDPIHKKHLHKHIQQPGVKASVFLRVQNQAFETLRECGIVDPKMVGALVKDRKIEIAIRHCEALDGIRAAKLEGVMAGQGKRPSKSHWRLAINGRCDVTWHRIEQDMGRAAA